MENFHDYEVIKYEVNLKEQFIILYMQFRNKNNVYNTKLIFSDVLVHYFENELLGSTILELEKEDLQSFIKDNMNLLNKRRDYLWPINYNTIQELEKVLKEEKYNYYNINSSYGLSGWILSKNAEKIKD